MNLLGSRVSGNKPVRQYSVPEGRIRLARGQAQLEAERDPWFTDVPCGQRSGKGRDRRLTSRQPPSIFPSKLVGIPAP